MSTKQRIHNFINNYELFCSTCSNLSISHVNTVIICSLNQQSRLLPLNLLLSSSSEALLLLVESAKADVSVLGLCEKGDAFIMAETGKVFKKEKDMKKGW